MALILNIETATEVCSVALAREGKLLALEEDMRPNSHSSALTVLIGLMLKKTNLSIHDLDAVAVSAGPGSYTGLRIGVSAAKGLCYALGKPLIAVSALKALAFGAVEQKKDPRALYWAVMESIKDEVFAAVYSASLEEIAPASPQNADLRGLHHLMHHTPAFIFGPGLKAARYFHNALHLSVSCTARNMISLTDDLYIKGRFCSLEYFEPVYLKNFVPKKPI